MDYSVMITYTDPDDSTNTITLLLDTVGDSVITASSTVTDHPTVHGTPMADHMYKNPITISIQGSFSLNGKKGFVFSKAGRSLSRVESIFEGIKNKGVLCTITKVGLATDVRGNTAVVPQFSQRENMVLQDITWTEKVNSLNYSFTFREAIQGTIQEYQVDPDDNFAPDIVYPTASNFSDTIIDWESVDREVLQALLDYDLCENEFLSTLSAQSASNAVISAILGVAIASTLTHVLVALGFAATVPVVGAVVAAVAFLILGIFAIFQAIEKKVYKVQAFKYYSNAMQWDKETRRFCEFYQSIHNKIAELDGAIEVYSVTENKAQEVIMTIDGAYYIFNFKKNNCDSTYKYVLNVSNIDGSSLMETPISCARTAFTDCDAHSNLLKNDRNVNSYVYLMRPNNAQYARDDLRGYFIVSSRLNPNDYKSALTQIIQAAIKY